MIIPKSHGTWRTFDSAEVLGDDHGHNENKTYLTVFEVHLPVYQDEVEGILLGFPRQPIVSKTAPLAVSILLILTDLLIPVTKGNVVFENSFIYTQRSV